MTVKKSCISRETSVDLHSPFSIFRTGTWDSLNSLRLLQMIPCLAAPAAMSDEIYPEITDGKVVDEKSEGKPQEWHRVSPSVSDEGISSNIHSMMSSSSLGSICVGLNLVSESNDAGILYLNPQDPKWSLVEEFAELSPRDKSGLEDEQSHRSGESLQLIKTLKNNESLKSSGVSANQRSSKLKERNNEDYPTVRGGRETEEKKGSKKGPARTSLKNHEDDKIARLLVAMKKRSRVDVEQRPFKCPHCHWAFKKFCNLQSHLQTHSGLKPHVCDICGKAYAHQGTLQQHKRLHTGERPYHCPFCVKTYIWSSDYRKHIRTHTGEKPYTCDTCGKDFIRSSDLRKHERNMHANDKPFPCLHCGKTFNKALSLKRHERKHLGERPYSCPDCGKAFTLASRMAEHQKIHAGVRPYVCSVCAKCFTKSSNLAEHEAIHSGVRPHKCKECGLAFAMASRLVRHQYVHSKEKRHSCTGCSKSFSHLETLKLHQEQRCAGRIFVCVECDKSFQCATKLSQHMLNHRDDVKTASCWNNNNFSTSLGKHQLWPLFVG